MASLQGQPGELRMKLTILRAATGKKEEVTLVGRCTPEELEKLGLSELVVNKPDQEDKNGSDA